MKNLEIAIYLLMFTFSAGLYPLLSDSIATTNTAAWMFPGHAFVALILPTVPMLFIIISITIPAYQVIRGWSKK